MSKLSKLAKDLGRSSKLTNRQAVSLKGGDDRRPRGGGGSNFSGRGYGTNDMGSFDFGIKKLGK